MRLSQRGRVAMRNLRSEGNIRKSYRKYNSYDENQWEKTAFFPQTGGYVVTSKNRILESAKNNQTQSDYSKEKSMATTYASWGFQIEHLEDMKQKGGNPDVRLNRRGPHIRVNGQLADLKRVESEKKVYDRGRDAITKNGAKIVMFEFAFPREGKVWRKRLNALKDNNWHGYYYFTGDDKYYAF